MSLSLSPQLRLVLLLGLLAIVGLSAGALALPRLAHRTHTSAATTSVAPRTHVHRRHATAPATSPARPPAPVEAAEPAPPANVQHALRQHRVVVVALYSPGSDVDRLALAEARAGARAAGAGFAAVDVADEASARWVASSYEHADDPGVLVLSRSGLVAQLFGYADRDFVAEAATAR